MNALSREEQAAAEQAGGADILPLVERWVAVNSGTRNVAGVEAMGTLLAFMMSVVALSLPEMIILRKALKVKLIAIYVSIVATGIILHNNQPGGAR